MRTKHYLFHVLGVTSESRVFVDSEGISLASRKLATDCSKAVILMLFLPIVSWSRCLMSFFVLPIYS